MKRLFVKNSLIAVLVAFTLAFVAFGCSSNSEQKPSNNVEYTTKGIYTAFDSDLSAEVGNNELKNVQLKVSTDGKYLLLVSAFDSSLLKKSGLYYMGYKYSLNGEEVDTTKLDGAKLSDYYNILALNTADGVSKFRAKNIYGNDLLVGHNLIVYEIEFETTYEQESALLENLCAIITEVTENQAGGYDVVEQKQSSILFDNSAYRVANGSFDNGLEGWTLTNTSGEKPFGGIDGKDTFWADGYAMNNVGNYFSAYAEGCEEASKGTLASSYFTANSEYATYMLGGAGNHNVYITIENRAGEVLALYRNTKFADFPAGSDELSVEQRRAMIGDTVFLANLVTYKVSIKQFAGQEIRFVVRDHASSEWGVVFFDELNTYYLSSDLLPENAILASNLLADKTALNAEIALEITEQGDYTDDSFSSYVQKLADAKKLVNDISATQEAVDQAATALTEARLALAVKNVQEVEGAQKNFTLTVGESIQIALSDYVNTNGLSGITYQITSNNTAVALSEIVDGKVTVTADSVSEETAVTISIAVLRGGEQKLVVELAVQIVREIEATVISSEVVKSYDLYSLENKAEIVINFAENVNNEGNLALTYSVKRNGEEVALDGTSYTFALGTYTDEVVYENFNVTVSFVANGELKNIEYTLKLAIKDTTLNRVSNASFEKGLDGWTLNNTLGEKPFGGIDNKETFWGEGYVMNNVGHYFSSYADDAEEYSQGNLASSYFVVRSEYATYMLGGAGNHNVYITIENKAGEVLALYRNTKFNDLPAGSENIPLEERREMIGNTVFLANFVTYKLSLADFMGQEVRFVVHDYASSGWGVVFFDELHTYYESADLLPENAVLAQNLLANKQALNAEIALEVTEQGDYTEASFNLYSEKLAEAKALVNDIAVTQERVDAVVNALTEARLALTVRPVQEVEGANKSFRLTSGNSKEIELASFVNTNGLSAITYQLQAGSEIVDLSEISDGKFTITAGEIVGSADAVVTIIVFYNGEQKLAIELNVQITNELAPTLFNEQIVKSYDVYTLENKSEITLDFAENVDNEGNLELTYSATYNGEAVALNGSLYTFAIGVYTSEITCEVFTVTLSFVANGEAQSIEYAYTLEMYDTTANRLVNGGFEDGLNGWTKVGNIGDVSAQTNYWVEEWENNGNGYEFGMDGARMFSAYAPGAQESAVGTLTSSTFTVGGSGFVTFKIGAMKDGNYVYVDVVSAKSKQILARYYNGLWAEYTDGLKSGCSLIAYKADLSAFMGEEVFFRISDNADSGYGLFFADSFITYYESEPAEFNTATPVGYTVSGTIYDLFNGGFEMNNVQGWLNNGEIGVVTNATGYWGDNIPYGKDGEYLFTGVESFGADTMREGNRGVLSSSTFEIAGIGYISFMLGGGGNELCYVQVIDVATNEVLARYRQQAQQDAKLIQYVADLSAYIGRTARIQVVDYASSGWGCVSFDNVKTYYANKDNLPAGITANNVFQGTYDIANGSFETGNIDGWNMHITEAGAHNTLGWVLETEIDAGWYTKNNDRKDGRFLFTFAQPGDINCENTKGSLESSTFTLKQGAYLSFRFGGAGTREVNIQLCRNDGTVIATFYNEAPGKANTEMYAYYYCYTGETADCYFRVYDNSTSNYGCVVVDDFRVNLESAPEGFIPAIR